MRRYNEMMGAHGLILFAHGARDPLWAEPFRRLRDDIATRAPGMPIVLAFLEHMTPGLVDASAELAARGVDTIRVVPLFFGRGGHLRDDLPEQIRAARAALPAITFEITEAAGENRQIQDALASFALGAVVVAQPDAR